MGWVNILRIARALAPGGLLESSRFVKFVQFYVSEKTEPEECSLFRKIFSPVSGMHGQTQKVYIFF